MITAHRLNYGEIKDPAKMTDSRMALVRRGLGAGNANANAQRQASKKARCGTQVCTAAAAAAVAFDGCGTPCDTPSTWNSKEMVASARPGLEPGKCSRM